MKAEHHRALAVCAAAPFIVAGCLVLLMLLAPVTGMIGPSSNTFFIAGAAAVIAGVVLGVASLLMMRQGRKWVRLLMGLMYLPTVLFSLLLAGA